MLISSSLQPTDSLNRPTELIPPGSPVRFQDLCNGRTNADPAGLLLEHEQSGPESSTEEDYRSCMNGTVVFLPSIKPLHAYDAS